jgi:signal transduction histidine kinase
VRTRLTAAILLLVAGTLVLGAAGGYVLIHRSSLTTAEQQLYSEARVVTTSPDRQIALDDLLALRVVGGYQNISVAALTPQHVFAAGLPSKLASVDLHPRAVEAGYVVAGNTGNLVFVLIPLNLTATQKLALNAPVAPEDTAVLVVTRPVHSPVTGLWYFVLVALVVLAIATVVAYWLANRFTRPLVDAVAATERVAAGDLTTRVPAGPTDLPEFAALARSIDAMAESLERARDQQRQFLLSVSHDLRTPLTSIRGYADAIAEGATDDVAGAVAVIAAEAQRLERLVADLLDLARLDARRFSYQSVEVDVDALVRSAVGSFQPAAAAEGLALTESLPGPASVRILADRDRVAQVLSNLVENAFKFARARVAVGARVDGTTAVLWVVDDGPGIPAHEIGRVFEPDYSPDRVGARRAGTGLGLAIVAELVAAMGGHVVAESPATAEGGTRITVRFPAHRAG